MSITITLDHELEKGQGILRLPEMTTEAFYDFCQRNPHLNVERNQDGDIVITAPSDSIADSRNLELAGDILFWNRSSLSPGGIAFGPSAGFIFPDGSERSPDAAWIRMERWQTIPADKRHPFAHIAPDFVAELMSPSDRLKTTQEKMEEYITNGVQLGWLIDPKTRTVYIYRPGQPVVQLDNPATVSGDPELPGLVVDMARVFLEIP